MQHAEVDDDGVGRLVGKRQGLGIADPKVDGGKQAARSLDHPIGEIDPGDLGAAHGCRRRQASRPTGHVEQALAASDAGGIQQARVAYERSNGQGRIHMNVLWEMAAAERVLHGVLEGARGMIDGVTCGAGMPYKIAEICARYGVYYYPIVSSARAFRA